MVLAYINILKSINLYGVLDRYSKQFKSNKKKIIKNLNKINDIQIYEELNENASNNYHEINNVEKLLNKITENNNIIYQTMLSKLKYNLSTDFNESYEKYINEIITTIDDFNAEHLEKLLIVYGDTYYKFYSSTLKKNKLLLNHAVVNNYSDIVEKVIASLSKLSPNVVNVASIETGEFIKKGNNKLINEYLTNIFEAIEILENKSSTDVNNLVKLVAQKEEQSKFYIESKDLINLSLATILLSIEKNNTKMLTDMTNSLLEATYTNKENKTKQLLNQKIKFEDSLDHHFNIIRKNIRLADILILSIIKSIELSHYRCAGFLVKVLCKEVHPKYIKNSIIKFVDEYEKSGFPATVDSVSSLEMEFNNTKTNFNFSKFSYEYCLQKSIMMIYVQQEYLERNNLMKHNYKGAEKIEVHNVITDISQLSYLREKITDLHKEYGMLSLKRTNMESNNNYVEQPY
ncbi:hypothetical protein [Alkalibacillus haloalkaliphilus]|uniref:hypothetical protein n=1 Tax=Alkalibacillus haloalkaliphilus TaxID=94136 RepID=UPI0012FD4F04|nr:hypothetical protein [Alkalibacillus haloalkaliphilus]